MRDADCVADVMVKAGAPICSLENWYSHELEGCFGEMHVPIADNNGTRMTKRAF